MVRCTCTGWFAPWPGGTTQETLTNSGQFGQPCGTRMSATGLLV
jgi:hypothetical protein